MTDKNSLLASHQRIDAMEKTIEALAGTISILVQRMEKFALLIRHLQRAANTQISMFDENADLG